MIRVLTKRHISCYIENGIRLKGAFSMWAVLRIVIGVFLSVNLAFSALFGGADVAVAMPKAETGEYGGYVNTFTGTGGYPWMCGMLSPAAAVPFGAVRLGPDTSAVGGLAVIKTNTSGYYYEHRHILGFSMSRLSGTGARDYGMFRVTPFAGENRPKALAFSHKNEVASPGYYAVYLPGAGAMCEMTAAAHAGAQRYTFSGRRNANLYVDAAAILSGGSTENARVSVDREHNAFTAQTTLFGTFTGRYGGLTVYLYCTWDAEETDALIGDNGASLTLRFGKTDAPVTMRAGISFVSARNAEENLLAELGDRGFDDISAAAARAWEARLSTVKVEADEATKALFYTSLYHTMLMPTDFTDVNGQYFGFDGAVHTARGYTYRTDLSLWDTARNAHALYTLIAPDIQKDSVQSLLAMADEGGVLPRWPMGAGYTGSMFGNPANLVLAESYLKGVDFDLAAAYDAVKRSTDGAHPGKAERDGAELYNEYGYLPADLAPDMSVSRTLEYAWEDAAAAVLARAAGDETGAAMYEARALNYRNLWDPDTRYFRPRNSDGSFARFIPGMTSFFDDIFGTSLFKAYCEGSAEQWRFSAQQDPAGLIALFGGPERFVAALESFMKAAAPKRAFIDPGAGFWIGNQHDIHTPYLFNEAGRPDLTQKWVRWTCSDRFSTDIDGLDGNDDGGTLSAWYVFSALGFYPVAGTDRYWIGSPCVNGAALTLANGKTLRIVVNNQSERNVYVSSVTLNGQPLSAPEFYHSAIADGGTLTFTMSDRP